jgi:ribonuclease VapC
MIVDASAIVAILREEPDAEDYVAALFKSRKSFIASPTYLELVMVTTGGRSPHSSDFVETFLRRMGTEIIPFTADMTHVATQAFLIYGKGRSNKAQLNFGDCISYATSKVELMPLLFKGDDFRQTDVECAI